MDGRNGTRYRVIVQTVLFIALFAALLLLSYGGRRGASSALNLGRNKVKIYDRKG